MKAFRYINGSDFRQVTEEQVRASIDALPENAPERANGEKVLRLAIGESVTFDSGADFKRIADDSEPFQVRICGSRARSLRCEFCRRMVQDGDGLLCDGQPKPRSKKKTCDAFMCRGCRKNIGPDRDLCPRCVEAGTGRLLREIYSNEAAR